MLFAIPAAVLIAYADVRLWPHHVSDFPVDFRVAQALLFMCSCALLYKIDKQDRGYVQSIAGLVLVVLSLIYALAIAAPDHESRAINADKLTLGWALDWAQTLAFVLLASMWLWHLVADRKRSRTNPASPADA